MAAPKLGIVAGGGTLPALLAKACFESNREFFLLAIDGFTDFAMIKEFPHAWIGLGEGGKGIEILAEQSVKEVVFAGPVRRPSLKEVKLDSWSIRFFTKLGKAWIGDDSLLSAIVSALEQEGFKVIGPDKLLADYISVLGVYGQTSPNENALEDIQRGFNVLKQIGELDIGQAAIVQHGVILGIEGAEGTDELMTRCAHLHREGVGGVLVKGRKPGQEDRIDLPAIGLQTIQIAAKCKLQGIAIEAGGVFIFERHKMIGLADESDLFVIGV